MKIELENLSKSFGPVEAVATIDLQIADGEFLALLGPSGCGKTTTLLMVAGIYKPSTGRIVFGERDVTRVPPKQRNLGMVFQSYALYPHMSAGENITFPLKLKGVAEKERRARAERMAEMMDIGKLLDRRPGQLSGGQQQRVALARALVKEPDALLFDEPLSNLDARIRLTMRSEIKRLQLSLAITSLYVTHDQVEALTMADRIAVMNQGRIEALGTPDEIYNRPPTRFVASFVGNPPMNFLEAESAPDAGDFVLHRSQVRLRPSAPVPGLNGTARQLVLGIRPEDIHLAGEDGPFRGEVIMTERLGREDLIVIETGEGLQLHAVVPPGRQVRMGDRVAVRLDTARLHVFDSESGRSLHAG
jgi:inositol-phosphate transport system ATP-binding protein